MLSQAQLDAFNVVLVRPRNPLNIGAAARSMANFGFARLIVVAPYEPHWQEAQSAVGAEELLRNAKVVATVADAVADCIFVAGTGTLTYRKAEQPAIKLPELPSRVKDALHGGRVAIVFGPEKHGLTREDLSHCHVLVEIPTDPIQPSMNLGQAVAVCLYELATRTIADAGAVPQGGRPATAGREELLAGLVEELMVVSDYSPATMREANRRDLRLLLRRLTLTDKDARRVLGFLRRALWKLRH